MESLGTVWGKVPPSRRVYSVVNKLVGTQRILLKSIDEYPHNVVSDNFVNVPSKSFIIIPFVGIGCGGRSE